MSNELGDLQRRVGALELRFGEGQSTAELVEALHNVGYELRTLRRAFDQLRLSGVSFEPETRTDTRNGGQNFDALIGQVEKVIKQREHSTRDVGVQTERVLVDVGVATPEDVAINTEADGERQPSCTAEG